MPYSRSSAAPSKPPSPDLWSLISSSLSSSDDSNLSTSKYVVFVGSSGSGKSSLIQQVLGKEKDASDVGGGGGGGGKSGDNTAALEYQFARRSRGNAGAKDVSHIFEVGGNTASLMSVPIRGRLQDTVVVIVLDMSQPKYAMTDLNAWMALVRDALDEEAEKEREGKRSEDHHSESSKGQVLNSPYYADQFGKEHPDYGAVGMHIRIPHSQIIVVANKFDLCDDDGGAGRKCLLQGLRYVAHCNGASLVCGSSKNRESRDMFKQEIRRVMFKKAKGAEVKVSEKWKGAANSISSYGPLAVKFGEDTFEAILSTLPRGTVKSDFLDRASSRGDGGRVWEKCLEEFYGKVEKERRIVGVQKAKDEVDEEDSDGPDVKNQFPEPRVDEARSEADLRLREYRKEADRRRAIDSASASVVDTKSQGRKSRRK